MKINTKNPKTFLSRWIRLIGVPLLAGMTIALLFVVFMAGCQEEDPGIVNVCFPPRVIRTSPADSATNVPLYKTGVAPGLKSGAAVKIITATFSTPMDPKTITTATFIVQQGTIFITGAVSYSDTTAFFMVPDGLGPNRTYTCTITTGVKDAAGTALASAHVWFFTTLAPENPTLISPVNGAVEQATDPTLIWNAVPHADTYRLQVSTTNNFTTTVFNDSTLTNISQQLTGLTVGTTYYWRVNAKVSGGTSFYSSVWRFTIVMPLAAPILLSPVDAAQNQATNLTLSWLASTGANTYRLQVSTNNSFSTTVYNDSINTGTSQPMTGLAVGTTYYWRVNAKSAAGTSAYSTIWSFTTIAPGTPTLVSPVDEAVDVGTNPTLIWNSVSGADTYRLQVSLNMGFVSTVYDDSTRTNIYQQISGLTNGTTYYWRVNSTIDGGTSAYSSVWSFTTIAPPSAPVLIAPVDVAQNQATNLTLSWLASMGATTYRLQVDTSSAFTSMVFDDSTITGISQPVTGLTVGTTYYWRVNAKNVAGTSAYSAVWSFTTIAPGAPTLVSPLDEAVNQATNPIMIWNAVPGTDTYRLQVDTNSAFTSVVFDDSTITGTSQQITSLNVGTTYYWRVNSKIDGGTSVYSPVWSFTTIAQPSTPVLIAPVDVAQNQATNLTLSWLASMGATTYRLQVDTSSAFTSMVFDDSTITGISQPVTGLTVGTTYYWRVNAKNVAGTSAYSAVWSFTTIAPGTPTLVSPLDEAVDQATNPIMIWNAVPGTDTYRLQVDTNSAFTSVVFDDSTITGTSQQITSLNVGTTYYWRVNSKIDGGTSAYSPVWSFTTIAPPSAPVLIAPADVAQNQATNLTLSWLASMGATTYHLQVDTSSAFTSMVFDDSTITGISQPVTGLAVGTTYYWRVNAKNIAGTSLYSVVWSFTTIAPGTPTLVSPLDEAVDQATNPIMIWNAVPGTDTYRLQVDTNSAFTSIVFDDSTITGTSQQITSLNVGTTYYWRVNSKIDGGTSAYSSVWSFTTLAPPAAPVLAVPNDAATNQATNLKLGWLASTGATTYRLQVDTNSTFTSLLFDDSTMTGTSQQLTNLTVGTTYYWRVNAKNVAGTSVFSTVWSFTTMAPPITPILVSPLDTAQNQATNLTLSWLASVGASAYRLQVSTNNTFSATVYDDSTITGISQPILGLTVGTTYYWRVNAKNAAGTSSYSTIWSFTTIVAALQPPTLDSPADAAFNISTSPTLRWLSSNGADTYRLQVDTSSVFANPVFDDSTLTGLSQLIVSLTNGTTYYWRVNAKNSGGTSPYSTTWRFTTIVTTPSTPTLIAPVDSAVNISTNPNLHWNVSTGAVTYRLQVDTSSAFTSTVFDDSTIIGTVQPISGLALGTTYYWRVSAKNSGGTSTYSTTWRFTTSVAALDPPILESPVDATIIFSTNPTLSWNASTGADTYRLQVDTSTVFASIVFDDSTLTGLSQAMAGLTYGTTYYWRVNAKNSGGTSSYSTIWRFTIGPEPPPPVVLGAAERFGAFGGSAGITNQGIFTQIFGSIGTTGASTLITGFHDGTAPPTNVFTETTLNIGEVRDTIYTATAPPGSVPGADATQGLADAQTAFNYLRDLPGGPDPGAGELGGLVLAPGTYTSASGTFGITLLDLTLDAQGDSNAQFIFQMSSSLTVGATGPSGARSVILINGAQPKNVFWVVGTGTSGAATINGAGGGTMVGTIIAYSGVTFSTVDNTEITTLNGRALGLNASVTMVNTVINVPLP